MDKYVWAECPADEWPVIKTIMAKSYNDAVEKIINKYAEFFDDDDILKLDNWDILRDALNTAYTVALSDLEIYEEI